jgi:hypothetical protein
MQQILCLFQVYRPPASVFSHPSDGRGNCQTCVPDEMNKQCSGYRPIRTTVVCVKVADEKVLDLP